MATGKQRDTDGKAEKSKKLTRKTAGKFAGAGERGGDKAGSTIGTVKKAPT